MDAPEIRRDSLAAVLGLALIPGLGPRSCRVLLERFGSAEAVLRAAPSQLRTVPGIGPKLARAVCEGCAADQVPRLLAQCAAEKISILAQADASYPRLLREIHDPPPVLFVRGQLLPCDALAVAIVGARHATHYGLRQAERLGRELAQAGVTVISGLARGIDAAAHRGALAGGGRTLAVLAGGLLNIYPPEHRTLAGQIAERGALFSEAPPEHPPRGGMFPQRNRLISGLSLGVVVVEAAARSGALISARHAMEQGREVFAVPGQVDCPTARGCHALLRDGATLVESVQDLLQELGPLVETVPRPDGTLLRRPAELQLNDQEQAVLQAVGTEPTRVDCVVADSRLPVHRVLATLSVLEMRHLVRRVSGTLVVRR